MIHQRRFIRARMAASAFALLCAALAACAPAQPAGGSTASGPADPAAGIAIETAQVSGLLFLPKASAPQPVVLVIGGSEGGLQGSGKLARGLADAGFAALAVAYFGHPGLPEQLLEIPLERFDDALAWLRDDPRVLGSRVAVLGGSKGAEAALLVAAAHPEIAAVIAGAPSHVVWQAIDQANWALRSSWTRGGVPLAFVPYDAEGPIWPLLQMYSRSLAASAAIAEARIPVESIRVPVLLVSGEDDQLWPSFAMGESVAQALAAAGNAQVSHLHYAAAGHAVLGMPFDAAKVDRGAIAQLGGTLEGNLAARSDAWPRVVALLKDALNAPGARPADSAQAAAGAAR
jgi:hypothetical protein